MRHNTLIINIMEGMKKNPKESNLGNMKNIIYLLNYEEIKRLVNRIENWSKRQGKAFRQ